MSRYGCENCKFCRCYPGDYWTPDEYECTSECEDITEQIFERVWSDGERWDTSEEQICPGYEEYIDRTPDYEDYMYERAKEAKYE